MSVIPESELTNVNFLMAPLPFDPATATRVILFVAPYDMFIDEAAIRYTVANGAALTGNISKLADGTAVSSAGTALTSAVDMDSTADTVLFSLGLKTDIDANRRREVMQYFWSFRERRLRRWGW